jgi:hypothetical protein
MIQKARSLRFMLKTCALFRMAVGFTIKKSFLTNGSGYSRPLQTFMLALRLQGLKLWLGNGHSYMKTSNSKSFLHFKRDGGQL